MTSSRRWTAAGAALLWAAVAAAGMHEGPAKPGSPALERLKQLVGAWEGPNMMDPKGPPLQIVYALTAAGNAVSERFGAGTPGEMLTVYYDQAGKTAMTHYCSIGNRPVMALQSLGKDKMEFDLVEGSVAAGEPHMHHLSLTFPDADHIKAVWTLRDPSMKTDQPHAMEFTRKN